MPLSFRSALMAVSMIAVALPAAALAQGRQREKPEILPLAGTERFTEADKKPMPPVNVPVDAANVWDLDLSNSCRVRIQLRPDFAPGHVERIKELTRRGFYNNLTFHRVIDGFMAQGGDPKGDGTGGSDLPDLKAEFSTYPHLRGTVSMARSADENSANSQFFIMLLPRMLLDGKYTTFGRVIEGMTCVDGIAKGEPPAEPTRIVRASFEAEGPGTLVPGSAVNAAPAAAAPASTPAPVMADPAPSPVPGADTTSEAPPAPSADPSPAPVSEAPPAEAAPATETPPSN